MTSFIEKNSGTKYIEEKVFTGSKEDRSVVSLFSGAGGLDIGLEDAGFETAVCVEFDSDCRETLRHNRPEWRLFEEDTKTLDGEVIKRIPGDVRSIDVNELLEMAQLQPGEASLVVGGAPCQPFSNIGKKLGSKDENNGDLFLEFVRVVKGVNPRAFIFENVVGITQQKHSNVIDYMVDKFKGLGYGISHAVLNAANYGVPQKRERFFLIGIKGVENPAFPLPTHFKDIKHHSRFMSKFGNNTPKTFKSWVSVKDAFDKIPKGHEKRSDYALMNISEKVINRMKYISQGENFKVVPKDLLPNCWKNGKHQGSDTFGRLIEELPSVTIRTAAYNPSKGMYIHPNQNRGLSTIEMATLQSFPYDWEFKVKNREKITLVSGGKQIGNAVPPGLAEALGKAIFTQLQAVKLESDVELDRHSVMS
jgi:DNA (cytosine-5)-methyltransferase 1